MRTKHIFRPSLDGRLESRLALNAAAPTAELAKPYPGPEKGEDQEFPFEARLTTGAYNGVLVNLHNATSIFGRSQGTDRDYARLGDTVNRQVSLLPYARYNGLTAYIRDALPSYPPQQSRELYQDIRSTLISYLGGEVSAGHVRIIKPWGRFFSDADIFGPGALINKPPRA